MSGFAKSSRTGDKQRKPNVDIELKFSTKQKSLAPAA